jgi:hypothetical protein
MNQKAASKPVWEITIDSDWITTGVMAVLFVSCGLLLAQEIHYVAQGYFPGPERLRIDYWSIFHKFFEVIVAIYFFVFAFRSPKRPVKIASALMGTTFAVFVLLSCFPISPSVGRIVAMSVSVVRQISLIIFCMAIAVWFKSVVHWSSPPEPRGGEN